MLAELYQTMFYPRHTSSDLSTRGVRMKDSPRFLKMCVVIIHLGAD